MSKLTHPGRLLGPVSHRHTVIRSARLLIRSLVPSALVPSQHLLFIPFGPWAVVMAVCHLSQFHGLGTDACGGTTA
jgi:hypothetical protein